MSMSEILKTSRCEFGVLIFSVSYNCCLPPFRITNEENGSLQQLRSEFSLSSHRGKRWSWLLVFGE